MTSQLEGFLTVKHYQQLPNTLLLNKQNKIDGEQPSCDKKH